MKHYTVIGRYYDNEQGYATHVKADDEDGAIAEAQREAFESYEDEDANQEPLEIVAVLAGHARILQTRDV